MIWRIADGKCTNASRAINIDPKNYSDWLERSGFKVYGTSLVNVHVPMKVQMFTSEGKNPEGAYALHVETTQAQDLILIGNFLDLKRALDSVLALMGGS